MTTTTTLGRKYAGYHVAVPARLPLRSWTVAPSSQLRDGVSRPRTRRTDCYLSRNRFYPESRFSKGAVWNCAAVAVKWDTGSCTSAVGARLSLISSELRLRSLLPLDLLLPEVAVQSGQASSRGPSTGISSGVRLENVRSQNSLDKRDSILAGMHADLQDI